MPSIDADALEVLALATCENQNLYLPKIELERDLYERVNEVIVRLGGKWKRGKKPAHVFAFYDPAPLLAAVVASGEMPPKNPTAFFPTPAPVIELMLSMMRDLDPIPYRARILEPSAGTGAIADAVKAFADRKNAEYEEWGLEDRWEWTLDCCEVLHVNRAVLSAKGHSLVGDDFMAWNPGEVYDAVVMNPPFSLDGDPLAYITHILHAWSLLKPGGVLGAVVPLGYTYRTDKKSQAFLDLVCEYGEWEEVEGGAFKESGTMIPTTVVALEKCDTSWRLQPRNGHLNWHVWEFGLHADNDRGHDEALTKIAEGPKEGQREAHDALCIAFADGMRRKHGSAVRLGEAELAALWVEFSRDMESIEEPSVPVAPVISVAPPEEVAMGGLFALA